MSNPFLKDAVKLASFSDEKVTHLSVYANLAFLGILAFSTALYSMSVFASGGIDAVAPLFWAGLIGGFFTAMITIYAKGLALITAPIYALLEGLCLGAVTAITEAEAPGAGIIAVTATFCCFGASYFLYATKIISATEGFFKFILTAMTSILAFYFAVVILPAFGIPVTAFTSGWLGLAISGGIIIVATISLILDFDEIDKSVGISPKEDAMYLAFGLMLGLVWIYLEILRFVGMASSNSNDD